jgi:hypothetical protein
MNNKFYVYILKDNNDKIFYVGKGCRSRNSSHRNNAKNNRQEPVYKKIRKLWSNGFDYKFEKVKSNLSEEEACNLEKNLIKIYGRKFDGGILLNVTFGGEGSFGYKHSEQTKQKMREAWILRRITNKVSEETKQKISQSRKGSKVSNFTKLKISNSIKGKNHWNFGNKGATKATQKMNEVSRKKIDVNGFVFDSVSDAANYYGIAISTAIYRAKNGKNRGEKYGIWKYV